MSKLCIFTIAALALLFALRSPARADAAAEQYVDNAAPLMHHSCASVVEEASGDEAYIDKVIRALVAVSLYNHKVDIAMFEISEENKTSLHDKFVEALKEGCQRDTDALLAGVIDQSVVKAVYGK